MTGLFWAPGGSARAEFRGPPEKAGPAMLNLKLGTSIPVYVKDLPPDLGPLDALPAFFALQIEAALAVDRGRRAYVLFPFQVHVGSRGELTLVKIVVPVGFQYDIPIVAVPGLYLYPRLSVGYAYYNGSVGGTSDTRHGAMIVPEFGVKYVLKRRWNFGFEPFGLPIHVFQGTAGSSGAHVDYRLQGYAGVNL